MPPRIVFLWFRISKHRRGNISSVVKRPNEVLPHHRFSFTREMIICSVGLLLRQVYFGVGKKWNEMCVCASTAPVSLRLGWGSPATPQKWISYQSSMVRKTLRFLPPRATRCHWKKEALLLNSSPVMKDDFRVQYSRRRVFNRCKKKTLHQMGQKRIPAFHFLKWGLPRIYTNHGWLTIFKNCTQSNNSRLHLVIISRYKNDCKRNSKIHEIFEGRCGQKNMAGCRWKARDTVNPTNANGHSELMEIISKHC